MLKLIELFSGYGSQALALKYLNIPFEHHFVCDFDKYAIQSYNDIHNTNFEPVDITKVKGKDLNITNTDKDIYILTYSFPCTDLSLAGKQKGMIKGSRTSSSLLWEVERLLTECSELPQYLLMENVPQVISKQNMPFFKEWILFLNKLGYSNNYELLNAKDYGIPQNRNRCFMISKLNDNTPFIFPEKVKLNLKIKNILDKYISNNKYYLPEKYLKSIEFTNKNVIADLHYTTYESSNKIYNSNGICPTLRACEREFDYLKSTKIGYFENNNFICRLLTPKEHLRLMGVQDNEIEKFTVNGNQQCKQAGNSIVVTVLMAIFKNLFIDKKFENLLF